VSNSYLCASDEYRLRQPKSSSDATPRNNKGSVDAGLTAEKRDDIPWPVLKKLSPSRLSRTASTLMSEWEKSLASPAHDSVDSLSEVMSKEQKSD